MNINKIDVFMPQLKSLDKVKKMPGGWDDIKILNHVSKEDEFISRQKFNEALKKFNETPDNERYVKTIQQTKQ